MLRVDLSFLKVFFEQVILHPSPDFLPMIVSKFHLAQEIVLPVFPHGLSSEAEKALNTLNVRRALYYRDRKNQTLQ